MGKEREGGGRGKVERLMLEGGRERRRKGKKGDGTSEGGEGEDSFLFLSLLSSAQCTECVL